MSYIKSKQNNNNERNKSNIMFGVEDNTHAAHHTNDFRDLGGKFQGADLSGPPLKSRGDLTYDLQQLVLHVPEPSNGITGKPNGKHRKTQSAAVDQAIFGVKKDFRIVVHEEREKNRQMSRENMKKNYEYKPDLDRLQ